MGGQNKRTRAIIEGLRRALLSPFIQAVANRALGFLRPVKLDVPCSSQTREFKVFTGLRVNADRVHDIHRNSTRSDILQSRYAEAARHLERSRATS